MATGSEKSRSRNEHYTWRLLLLLQQDLSPLGEHLPGHCHPYSMQTQGRNVSLLLQALTPPWGYKLIWKGGIHWLSSPLGAVHNEKWEQQPGLPPSWEQTSSPKKEAAMDAPNTKTEEGNGSGGGESGTHPGYRLWDSEFCLTFFSSFSPSSITSERSTREQVEKKAIQKGSGTKPGSTG